MSIDTPVSLDRQIDEEPMIKITKVGWAGYMWDIPIPDTLCQLSIDRIYPTKKWALWAARRHWVKHQKEMKVEYYLRNVQMLEEGHPDLVLAFSDNLEESKGTAMMVKLAKDAGVPVYVIGRG
jgi:hypothetical protein